MVLKGDQEHFDYVLACNTPLALALATQFKLDFKDCDERNIEFLRQQVSERWQNFIRCCSLCGFC